MRKLMACLVALVATTTANAGVVFFTNQATWQGAAGPATFTENFSGFASDTQYRTASVPLNGMTITQEGVNANFRNLIEVAPFSFTDNNGTSHASAFTEGTNGTFIRIAFDAAASAFGFQSWGAASGEGATLEVYNGATLLGSFDLTNAAGAFLGFITNGGDVATSVRFRSTTSDSSTSAGEGFGLDNLALVSAPVPEPISLVVFGGLIVGGGLVARKRLMAKKVA